MRAKHSFFDQALKPVGQLRRCAAVKVNFWQRALVLGAVLSLLVNVATRFCVVVPNQPHGTNIAQAHSLDGKRQRLLNDGLQWSAPVATFVLLHPTQAWSSALPKISVVPRLCPEQYRYSRPPPSC